MSDLLVRLAKDGDVIEVHPTCVDAHVEVGYHVCDKQSDELEALLDEPAAPVKSDPFAAARAAKAAKKAAADEKSED
jgi:hypothetical protein